MIPLRETLSRFPFVLFVPRLPHGRTKTMEKDGERSFECKAIVTLSQDFLSVERRGGRLSVEGLFAFHLFAAIVELFTRAPHSCLHAIFYAPLSILHFSIPSTRISGFHASFCRQALCIFMPLLRRGARMCVECVQYLDAPFCISAGYARKSFHCWSWIDAFFSQVIFISFDVPRREVALWGSIVLSLRVGLEIANTFEVLLKIFAVV